MKSLDVLGVDFLRRHEWLLAVAKANEVAICGSCAASVVMSRTDYVPPDLDLVTTKANALRFIDAINHFLLEKNVHYRIYANCNNDFVPNPAIGHFRIQCPFWIPVCLFVLPHDQFRYYRIHGGHLLQMAKDVKQAADALTERDEKPRLANEPMEDLEDLPDEQALDDGPDPMFFDFTRNDPPEADPILDSIPYSKPL